MMNGKKIVFFTGSMGRGGAERVISILSDYLIKNGWNVTIGMLLHDIVHGYEINEQVEVKPFFSKKGCKAVRLLSNIKNIRKYIKTQEPDVVVAFMSINVVLAKIACIGLNVRFIGSERIDPAMAGRNFVFRKFVEWAYSKTTGMIFQTNKAKSYFNEEIQKKGVIIGNPIKIECEACEKKHNKIVTVGRLYSQKNQKMLIDAFAEVVKKHPQYILEIYGEGPERKNLEAQIIERKLEKNVFLQGSKKNVHECIRDASIFALSSDYEGLSNALLEAMMMGIACVSTNCAGSDEIIKNGENGILVPIKNKKEMTQALLSLVENEQLREKLAKNGKESVQKYKLENIVEQWMEVITGR